MRATWSAPGGATSYQGVNNQLTNYINNTLKRALTTQRDALWMDHQQEDAVSGGNADTIQFHYLLMADTTAMTSSTVIPTAGRFDANQGSAGSATTNFGLYATRRDFDYKGRGF
jgi:hypothetical protein